ncbi:hypothetical protein ABPG74_002876 [Tetrahymena malaccensis]
MQNTYLLEKPSQKYVEQLLIQDQEKQYQNELSLKSHNQDDIKLAFLHQENFNPVRYCGSQSYFQSKENFAEIEKEVLRIYPAELCKDLFKIYLKEEILNCQKEDEDLAQSQYMRGYQNL